MIRQRKANRYRDRIARRGVYRHDRYVEPLDLPPVDTRSPAEAMGDVAELAASLAGVTDPDELKEARRKAEALYREESSE